MKMFLHLDNQVKRMKLQINEPKGRRQKKKSKKRDIGPKGR